MGNENLTAFNRSEVSQRYTAKTDICNSGNIRVTHWAQRPRPKREGKQLVFKI